MIIEKFNSMKEYRKPTEIKVEICEELLKVLHQTCGDEEVKQIIVKTVDRTVELIRTYGKAVKKLDIMILDRTLKEHQIAYRRDCVANRITKSLTDKVFRLISDICDIDTQAYFKQDFEFLIMDIAETIALLEHHTSIVFDIV